MIRAPDTKLAAAVLAAVALLAACGSDSGLGTAPTSTPTPTETVTPVEPTPTPTVVALTREQAADLYLEIVTPTNDALESLDAVLIRFEEGDYTSESALLEEIREAALAVEAVRPEEQARLVELQSTAIEGIDPVVWRDAMADLLRGFSGGELWYHALTEVQTWDAVYDAAEDFGTEDTGAADVVRAYLGLPTRS
jgi:hypothetical protein